MGVAIVAAAVLSYFLRRYLIKRRPERPRSPFGEALDREEARLRSAPPSALFPYVFAHRELPGLLHGRPALVHAMIERGAAWDDPGNPITALWNALAGYAGASAEPHPTLSVETVGTVPALLVTMPPPLLTTHAHFVAAVPHGPGILYITLERSLAGKTILGAWKADGGHQNLGEGPPPERGAFLAAAASLVRTAPTS
jgi:hypothetical protein